MRTAFDATATWVTQLSWKKFLLFALLLIIGGSIVQDTLFRNEGESQVLIARKKQRGLHSKLFHSDKQQEIVTDDGTSIRIDASGLHITKNGAGGRGVTAADNEANGNSRPLSASAKEPGARSAEPAAPGAPGESVPSAAAGGEPVRAVAGTPLPQPPNPPPVPRAPGVHISLPPDVGDEVQSAIEDAVKEAAEQKVSVAQKKSSEWFMNFILLLIVGLFGTKALMGGKHRAEAAAQTATAAADRATLEREIAEAKMQVMQAQVEPHFLFNTLASVEYLIETDPPRASAMQRRLIQYLRAVLPQMRNAAAATTLGREADMVGAYLDLLKMRMEERLHVDFHIPAGLRSAAFPPMMLQSLVENAIKHGLERKAEGGTLEVLAEVVDNRLRVTVADDGLGFGAVPSDGTGLGLQSIRERLKLLYQDTAQLEITANAPTGVRSTIDVPYQLAKPAAN